MGDASMLSGWRQCSLIILTFAAMLITAKAFSKSEAKNERHDKTGPLWLNLRSAAAPSANRLVA